MQTVSRRGFLKATGVSGGLAVLAARPARAGPKKNKTLADVGRSSGRLLVDKTGPPSVGWPTGWPTGWP